MRGRSAWRGLGWAASGGVAAGAAPNAAMLPVHVSGHHTPQSAVVFLPGDRIPVGASECTPLVARLQQPAHVAGLLAAKFPGATLIMAPPTRYAGDFACFDDFLRAPLSSQGIPRAFDPAGFPAAHALAATLAAGGLAASIQVLPPLVLLGFSKGAVVLHQVLAELAAWQKEAGDRCAVCAWEQEQAGQPSQDHEHQQQQQQGQQQQGQRPPPWQAVLAATRHLHFLDAGANSPGAAHPHDPAALLAPLHRRCAAHALHIHLHGTPRQWRDPRRRWLGRESGALAAAAAALGPGVVCTRREYCVDQPPSLEAHFAVIQAFDPCA